MAALGGRSFSFGVVLLGGAGTDDAGGGGAEDEAARHHHDQLKQIVIDDILRVLPKNRSWREVEPQSKKNAAEPPSVSQKPEDRPPLLFRPDRDLISLSFSKIGTISLKSNRISSNLAGISVRLQDILGRLPPD